MYTKLLLSTANTLKPCRAASFITASAAASWTFLKTRYSSLGTAHVLAVRCTGRTVTVDILVVRGVEPRQVLHVKEYRIADKARLVAVPSQCVQLFENDLVLARRT